MSELFSVEWGLGVVLGGLVTLLFAGLGSVLMWKLIGPRVVEGALRARLGPILVEWFTTPVYETGKKTKYVDEKTGKHVEKEEVISPLEMIISGASDVMQQKLYSKMGVDARKLQVAQGDIAEALLDPANPMAQMLGGLSPALLERAIKDGDYIPVILQMFGPQIKNIANTFITKKNNTTVSQPVGFGF